MTSVFSYCARHSIVFLTILLLSHSVYCNSVDNDMASNIPATKNSASAAPQNAQAVNTVSADDKSPIANRRAEKSVNLISRYDGNARYAVTLLKKALPDHQFYIARGQAGANDLKESLEKGTVDAVWAAPTPELRERFAPVPVDIFDGLLGVRLCITHNNHKKPVYRLRDLKNWTFASGIGWSDTETLKKSGLTVIEARYRQLFNLVRDKKADCFPRGAFEPWDEINQLMVLNRGVRHFKVNKNFALRYENPFYIWVRKDSPLLSVLTERFGAIVQEELPKTSMYRNMSQQLDLNTLRYFDLTR